MAIIILESIGFSATHSISDMLSMNGKNCVSHGSKNFRKRQRIGKSDLSFSEFFKEMHELQDEHANCISVHSVYSPAVISQAVRGTCARFYGLARRSQKDQILSCFFLGSEWFFKWAAGLQSSFGTGSHTLCWRAKQTGARFKFSELFDDLCNATRSKI